MPALTGDLYSMTRSASSGIKPFRLPSLKKDEDNETEQIMDQEQTDISLNPAQTQEDTQDGPLSNQAEPEAFDALMQRMDRLVNLARTFKGEDWMPTATEQQAIKTIFENSTDPDEAVGKFITALGVHDAMPQLSITDAYNSLDEISRFYSGKDYTAFDQSWLQKIKNGFTYMDIQNDMVRWMELDLADDPKAAEMEEQIRQKLEELGGLKSAIPTGWLDSVSDAVLENIGYMVVPSVQAAATAAVTKGALSTMISLFGLNPIAAASAGAVAGTVAAASGVATQFERIARGQTAQSYWDYMHDYEGSTPNKTSAQILATTNGIFVGLTETFLDGVMSRAGGALLSKVAGKSVDRLGVNMLMNLDTSGSASRLGRAVFEWATGAVDEGFLNEFPQAIMDELMAAAYRSSIDLPADFDLGETFREALSAAADGLLVGAVYGTLSIPGAMQNDVITAAKLRRAANTSKNYQDFLYQTKDYKPDGVSEDAFEEARKAVWEKSESDKAELLKGSVLETVSIAKEELYNTFDEDGMDQAEVVPDGSVYRTDKGELYKETVENRDGSYTVYFGDRDTGAVYGSVDIDTDGSEISIRDVRVRYGYEGIRSEMVTDSIADIKTSELDVKWEPTTPGLQAVKQDIISANPNGPDSGLNYIPVNSSELKGLEDSIRKAFPSFTPQQVKVSAVLYSLADSDKALSDVNQGQRFASVSSMTVEELQGNSASSIRGAANKAKALIYTAENSDPSTFTHELFHVVSSVRANESAGLSTAVRNTLDDETERATLRTFVESNLAIWNDGRTADDILSNLDKIAAGQKTWTAPVEEDLARLYEAYRASKSSINTNLPTGLKKMLERLADAIRRVYRAIREIVPVNREIASAFDRMMGISESSASNTKSAEARQSTDSQTRFQGNKTSDILYQTDSGAVSDIDGTLVLTHELAEYKLEKIDELGGMPMPSLAISKPGISSDFGDIILVGSADLARKVIDRGYVYDRDIWSPMVPKPEYTLTDKNRKIINRWLASTGTHVTLDNYYKHQYSDPEDISRLLSASEDIKKAYLKSKGIEIEVPYKHKAEVIKESIKSKAVEYVSNHPVDYDNYDAYVEAIVEYIRPEVEKLIEAESKPFRKKILRNFYLDEKTEIDELIEYAENPDEKIVDTDALSKIIERKAPEQEVSGWIYENILPYYSEPFVTVGRKRYPYNIENIFRSMIHDSTVASAQNGGFAFNDGLARSYAARKLTSRAVIADNEYLLSQEESEEVNKLHEAFRTEAAKRYAYPNSFEAFNDANRALGKYLASGHRTDAQLKKIFGSYDFSVDQTFISMVNNLAESIDNMGRKYFEAKPAEIMQISDFSAALIPQGISEKAKDILAKSGVDVFTYSDKASAVSDYLEKTDKNILFQQTSDLKSMAMLHNEIRTVDDVYEAANKDLPFGLDIIDFAHKISDPTPLFSYKRQSLKSVERSSEKIKDDYEGDARALKDVYGGTLVYSSYEDIRKAFAGLNRIESLPVYEFKEPKQSAIGKSYWDYKINFLMPNGTVGEIILIHEYIDTMKNGVLEDGKRKVSGIGHKIYEITRKFDRARTRYADSLTKDQLSVINSMREILVNVSNEIYSNIHFDENSLFESISNAFSLDTNQLLSGVSIGTEKDTINFDSLLSSESLTGLQVSLSSATRYALEYSTSQTAKLSNRSSSSISIDKNINPNLANINSWQELYNTELQDVRFQKVTDPAEIARLEDDEKVKAYRAVQLINGRIYSPMATVVDGRMVPDQQIGTWYRSDENPDLAIPDVYDKGPKKGQQKVDSEGNLKWKFKLEKGTKGPKGEKLSDVPAAYNPYWHSSASPLNDQFSSAYKRPNLAVVEVEIPKSDLDSGYRAYKAKDAVGPTKWHSGVVSTQLAKLGNPRTVYLSRYCKILRIVPDSEVAAVIKDVMEGTGISIPDTLVTPSLKTELEKKGVAIDHTDEVKDYYSDFDGDISEIELALTKKKAKQTADRLSGNLFQDALPEDIAVMDDFPVFDDYIEAGAMDAMQYEAMAEEAARIERELLGIDYTENYQAEDMAEDDEPQGEDPFALDEEYIRRSPYRVVKGLDKDWLRSIGYEFIMDDNPGWTFREFAENNMPQVQYEGTDAQKDQTFSDALSDDINLRGYLSILGAAMLLDTTALNGGYEERYNPTYKRYERVAIEAPYTDQNYRLGLQQRVLKQIQSPAIVNAARYVLKNQSWPKNDKVRQAVLEELRSNPRAYRNLIASISGNESMKMESVADVDERRGLDIPTRESLDLMPVDELADLARRIRREDIARKIENGSLKMGGDADQSALDEVVRVLKEQRKDLADREKEVKSLTEANTTLQEDVRKLDEAVGERDRILKEAESILESLRNAAVTDAPHEIRDSLSSEEAELLSKKRYLTASESEYQKAATAKGSREKGKAIGARMGTANWLKDMEKFYPDIFVDENGNTLNSSVNKNSNEYKTIQKNIESEIERINTRLNEITAERVSSLVRELGAAQGKVRSELAKLDKAAQASQAEEAKELGRQVKSLKKKNDRLAEKISDIRKDLSASKHEAKKLTAALEKAKASVKAQRDELADDRKEIRSLSSKMATLQKKLAKAVEKAKSDIKSLRENVKRKQQEKRALQVIKDKKAALAREIMRPVNLKTTDFDTSAEAIMAIQALIDPAFRRDWVYDLKTDPEQKSGHETMTIDQAKAYFNSLDDAQRIDLMSYLDQSLIDRLTEQKKPLNDWTVEELRRLAEEVSDLRRRGQAVLSAKRGVEKDRTLQIQRAIIANLRKAGMAKKKGDDDGNIPGSLDPSRRERSLAAHYYKFRLMGLRMQEIAQLLDGGYGYKGQAYKLLVEDKRYHQNRRDRMIEKRMARVEPLLTPKAVENMCDRVTVNLGDISRDFTVDQLAYAWLSQRDDQNKAAVMYGSLLSAEEKGTSAGTEYDPETGDPLRKWLMDDKVIADDDELRAVATMRYSALLRSAENELTSRGLMDLVEAISEDFNDPANAARLNRACIEAYNTPLDLREYYLAINRIDSNGKPLNDSFAANFFDPVTNSIPVNPEQGMRISRIEISPRHQTAVDMSLLNVWQNAVKTQEHLIEHASYVKQLHSVFNFYGSKEVVSAMDNAYGSALRREVASYIDLVSNPYKHEQSESINAVFRVLRQGLGAAYLGWKMSGIVLQAITSPFPGLVELSPARLAGAYLHIARHPVETIRFINEKSVMMKNRTMNMIIDEAQQRRNRWDRNKVQKAMDKFEEVGQIGLTMVDRYAVAGSWLGMYYKTLDEGLKSGMTTETADAAAVKAADDFILKTQPVGDPTELASMFRSKNEAVKAVLQFTTSLNVIWNNLTADMAGSMKSRNFSQVIGTVFGYAAAGVILGLVAEGFDDDEDRHIRKLIYWATTQGTGSVPLLGSTADYMVKKLLTGESGYTSSGSLFPGVDRLTQAVSALSSDDWPKLAKKAAEAVALFSGLPYSGYKEAMLAIKNKSIEPLLGRR